MQRLFLLALLLSSALMGFTEPFKSAKTQGNITHLSTTATRLYVSTDSGVVEIFSLKDLQKRGQIQLPSISNFINEHYLPKVFIADSLDEKQILILAEGSRGSKDFFLCENNQLHSIFSLQDNLNIAKAQFVTQTQIILALMSNEILLYDFKNKQFIYRKQISNSPFSDFTLSKDREHLALSCESGIIYYIESRSGRVLKEFSDVHKDNVYQLALRESYILSAGRDRKVGVISLKNGSEKSIKTDFLVYSVGVGEKLGAYMLNEQGDISVFNLSSLSEKERLVGTNGIINSLIFLEDQYLIGASSSPNIFLWRISNE